MKYGVKAHVALAGDVHGLVTKTYLSAAEDDLLASLGAEVLSRTLLNVPPAGGVWSPSSTATGRPALTRLVRADPPVRC